VCIKKQSHQTKNGRAHIEQQNVQGLDVVLKIFS
jgi:hypothetical protein